MKHLGVADVKELPDFERLSLINIAPTLEATPSEVNQPSAEENL